MNFGKITNSSVFKSQIRNATVEPVLKSVNKLLTSTLCKSGEWHGPVTDHFDGKRFYNYYEDERTFAPDSLFAKWWLSRKQEHVPKIKKNKYVPDLRKEIEAGEWECTLINHATHLIRFQGINILTDPVWSDRASPLQFAGPKRRHPPAIDIDNLPPIDAVVVSHDHYDHLDIQTLQNIDVLHRPVFIVPLGNKMLLEHHDIRNVIEIDWWESVSVKNTVIYLTPARHYSARYRETSEKNKTLWGGFYFKHDSGVSVYFCGDTAWTKSFADIKDRLGAPDLALLSTGAYKPRALMKYVHMAPAEAVKAFKALGAKRALAFHYGTWRLTDENESTMRRNLSRALERSEIPEELFIVPGNGKTTESN